MASVDIEIDGEGEGSAHEERTDSYAADRPLESEEPQATEKPPAGTTVITGSTMADTKRRIAALKAEAEKTAARQEECHSENEK